MSREGQDRETCNARFSSRGCSSTGLHSAYYSYRIRRNEVRVGRPDHPHLTREAVKSRLLPSWMKVGQSAKPLLIMPGRGSEALGWWSTVADVSKVCAVKALVTATSQAAGRHCIDGGSSSARIG